MSNKLSRFFGGLQLGGKLILLVMVVGLIWGGTKIYRKVVPEKAKEVTVTTKTNSLPPLAYDKNANAPERKAPDFNSPSSTVQGVEMRGELMGWNAQMGLMYAVGGTQTAVGSIAEELGLNVHLDVQNSCAKQGTDLYAFAQSLKAGNPNPSEGCHFIAWMGDGVPSYFAGLTARIKKDLGDEYIPQVITFGGASFGEDKWLIKAKYKTDARGSVNVGVIRDGDWNVAHIKCDINGWKVNYDNTTYDRGKVNFIPAPDDDYMKAVATYVAQKPISLAIVENGKRTGKDTLIKPTGVVTWFPGDLQAVQEKGGLICIASTKDFGGQMGNAIIFIKKWAQDNKEVIQKFVEMVGKGGDQVKSHDEALHLAAKVSDAVYKDQVLHEDDWYKGYKSYDITDDDGNTVNIGGSRVFNLADAAAYTGVEGNKDAYKSVYNTFGKLCVEAYPEIIPSYPAYEESVDWSYLRAVWAKNRTTSGSASKVDYSQASKGEVVGDASYSIEFQTGSATISPSSYEVLDGICDRLNVASNLFVDVAGHTDNTGNPEANQALSEARALSVKKYIADKNGDEFEQKTSIRGYGQSRPLDPSANQNSPQVKAKNRRVEIKLYKAKI